MSRFKKWINLGLGLAALALWLLLRQMLDQVWEIFRLPVLEDGFVQLPTLIAAVVAVGAFLLVRGNAKAFGFLDEVATELSKVSWPTMDETVKSTGVIIVMVAIATVLMFGYDLLWGSLTSSLLRL